MAESKLIKANQKIENAITDRYKKIEKTVVNGYTKIENFFVDRFLTHDSETVQEAKKRLKS